MAAGSGSVIWGERPLTLREKRMAGSSKMAADGGSVFWGERPLRGMGKKRRRSTIKETTGDVEKVTFNDNHHPWTRSHRDHNNVRRGG